MEIKSLFEDIKSYFPGDSFYIIVPLALVLLIALIVFIIIKRRRKRRKEMKTAAMIDRMSLHRAAINTAYLEKDFSILLQLVYSYYSQQPQLIPNQGLTPELYMEWYNELKGNMS